MSPEEICNLLTGEFGDAIVETVVDTHHPHAVIKADAWPAVADYLRDDEAMGFDLLRCITAIDLVADNQLAAVYDLLATQPGPAAGDLWKLKAAFAITIKVDRDDPRIPSVAHVWPTADWHEREAYDMMGIVFEGHPDLRRILCPDDWEGFPLRKDYVFPREYQGIPGTTEYDLTNPVH
jgi:NADH-quinone oxidoreductase subunit C